jgi:hypothetical protein
MDRHSSTIQQILYGQAEQHNTTDTVWTGTTAQYNRYCMDRHNSTIQQTLATSGGVKEEIRVKCEK